MVRNVECSRHHGEYHALVNTEILTASKQIDLDIKVVQLGIADTAKPGLAAEALRMKNDLQGLKEKLEQIGKSLEQEQTATHQPGCPSWNALSESVMQKTSVSDCCERPKGSRCGLWVKAERPRRTLRA